MSPYQSKEHHLMPKVAGPKTESRKADHIRINLEENVQFPNLTTGLETYHFVHNALPELDLEQINTTVRVFGRQLKSPLLISSMTGGTEDAYQINQLLAEGAQTHRIAMGLGSQRAALELPELASTFQVRKFAPDILLLANLGAIQLNYGYDASHCQRAIDMVDADALILHINVVQESVQPEGDTRWSGLLKKIEKVCKTLEKPVIIKEVGWGISEDTARRLAEAGVAAIDVAGSGGTSWSEVEFHRAPSAFHAQVARAFADWGIPTADTLQMARRGAPQTPLFASGGLRDGLDIAKCIALGATLGGMASPFLKAAAQSAERLDETIRVITRQLQIVMLATGAQDISSLQNTPLLHAGLSRHYL
jgi:isopentenyl-diphosphate delta-isomerase